MFPQPHQKPTAAEAGRGLREDPDFHQQHPEERLCPHPHRAPLQAAPAGESGEASGRRKSRASDGGWGRVSSKAPNPGLQAQLRTGPRPVSGEPALSVTSVPRAAGRRGSETPDPRPWAWTDWPSPLRNTAPLQGGEVSCQRFPLSSGCKLKPQRAACFGAMSCILQKELSSLPCISHRAPSAFTKGSALARS